MSAISVAGDTSGSVTLQAPAVAGSSVLTLPAVSGTVITNTAGVVTQAMLSTNVAGNGPAFRAYMSTAQVISGSTLTKLNFNAEVFDTNSNYDNVTNYRFTPTVAGYYQVHANIYTTATFQLYIYKNGAQDSTGMYVAATGGSSFDLVYLNGSTDYIEVYYFGGAITTSNNTSSATQFSASMVRSA